jgi:hypothetical protein
MRKLLALSFLLLFATACGGADPEPLVPKDANARTLGSCTTGYSWAALLTSPYTTVTPNMYWKVPLTLNTFVPLTDAAVGTLTVEIRNGGTASFRWSTKGGAVWNTLAPGATATFSKGVTACGSAIVLTLDVERLSCGSVIPESRVSGATSPHSANALVSNMNLGTWTAPACTL